MKFFAALVFSIAMVTAPVNQAQASDISTSVVVGVVVANYAGALAGVAASSLLTGTNVLLHSAGKEAAVMAAQNDVQNFYSTGSMSLALQNSVKSIQILDESISQEEAMDLILESAAQ
jgi:hypothetical protein